MGWEAGLSPRGDALVERVSGAGHGSHSHPQEKLGQKLFLEKRRVSSFPSSSQARGGEVMEHWARRRTCLRLGVIPSPGPQPVLAGAGGEFRGPNCPSSPTFLPVKPPHPEPALGLLPSLPPAFPSAVSVSQRRARLRIENQPQMWRSSCCWSAMSGDGQGLGTRGQQEGPIGWPGPESQYLLGVLSHLSGDSVLSAAGCSPGRGEGHPGAPQSLGRGCGAASEDMGQSPLPSPILGLFFGKQDPLLTGARSPLLCQHPPPGAELSPGGGTAQPGGPHEF